jgi:hypothetical protein
VRLVKVELRIHKTLKGKPDGVLKSGSRLDSVLDALTTAQAAGASEGANVIVSEHYLSIVWEEER